MPPSFQPTINVDLFLPDHSPSEYELTPSECFEVGRFFFFSPIIILGVCASLGLLQQNFARSGAGLGQ